jgi:hypothetical protein
MDVTLFQVPDFVAGADLQNWVTRIVRNRRAWQPCFEGNFSTYGRAWYVEIEEGNAPRYHAEATAWNQRLERFSRLSEYIQQIATHLPRRVPVVPRRSILGPYWVDCGFTIYERDGESGVAHTDMEGLIPYPSSMFDATTEAYSATIAVECPESGGGLWVDPRARRLGHYSAPRWRTGWKLHSYRPGTLTVFDSFLPHAIEGFHLSRRHSRRTILIVHFLYRSGPYPHYQYWL